MRDPQSPRGRARPRFPASGGPRLAEVPAPSWALRSVPREVISPRGAGSAGVPAPGRVQPCPAGLGGHCRGSAGSGAQFGIGNPGDWARALSARTGWPWLDSSLTDLAPEGTLGVSSPLRRETAWAPTRRAKRGWPSPPSQRVSGGPELPLRLSHPGERGPHRAASLPWPGWCLVSPPPDSGQERPGRGRENEPQRVSPGGGPRLSAQSWERRNATAKQAPPSGCGVGVRPPFPSAWEWAGWRYRDLSCSGFAHLVSAPLPSHTPPTHLSLHLLRHPRLTPVVFLEICEAVVWRAGGMSFHRQEWCLHEQKKQRSRKQGQAYCPVFKTRMSRPGPSRDAGWEGGPPGGRGEGRAARGGEGQRGQPAKAGSPWANLNVCCITGKGDVRPRQVTYQPHSVAWRLYYNLVL